MWEKSERNTWEQKIYCDRSDRSGPTASLFDQTGLGDRSDSDKATASFWEKGIYTPHPHPFVSADAITFQTHLWVVRALEKVLPNLSLWDLSD